MDGSVSVGRWYFPMVERLMSVPQAGLFFVVADFTGNRFFYHLLSDKFAVPLWDDKL